MRVTVYDKNPGVGFVQWFLSLSWMLGCWYQKLLGKVDEYYGATSWDDALVWLTKHDKPLTSIQYWGHGSPGCVWLAQKLTPVDNFFVLKGRMAPGGVIWFRTCSTFQGLRGYNFSQQMADGCNCVIAGHTRIIGLLQGGLHTRKPGELPRWAVTDDEPPAFWLPVWLHWGEHTVTCFATKIPEGW